MLERNDTQLTPRESQAASTSGLASCRNIDSLNSDPVDDTILYFTSISFTMGAKYRKLFAVFDQIGLVDFSHNIEKHASHIIHLNQLSRRTPREPRPRKL